LQTSLVIQTSFLGDTILTTPLMSELAGRGPVDVLTTPGAVDVLRHHPAIREVLVFDKRGADRGLPGVVRAARRLGAYDRAYIAQSSVRSALLARFARIPVRIGFADAPGSRWYTVRVAKPSRRHQAERLWLLAFENGPAPDEMPAPSLVPGDAERTAVDSLLAGYSGPLIALAPGSVWATKRWPYYEALAVRIAAEGLGRIAVIGGPEDASAAEIIRARVNDAVVAAGRLSVLGSAELVRRACVLVTNDSSPTHIASAVGTPTVMVYGPTWPGFGFGPLAQRSRVVQHEAMPCRPCHQHGPKRCPLGHWKCMVDLPVERVIEAVSEVLAPGRATSR
jgi:heptosyltransferase-2